MESYVGQVAVVTGGGTGMGRELVMQLAEAGASVATCDVQDEVVAETVAQAKKVAPSGATITAHHCDVSSPQQVATFRDEVRLQHQTNHINLLFNNAGIAGGGSFLQASQSEWDRTFGVTWGGVYNCSRAFVPLLVAGNEGVLVNTSSVNGFWAALGPGIAHTAYSSAKFAVKGFTEALIEDFRLNAPHVRVALVMPGHIGTDIVANTQRIQGSSGNSLLPEGTSPEDATAMLEMFNAGFRDNAPMSAAQAATRILDAVLAGEWRILVGEDAVALDNAVRADPVNVYGPSGISLGGILSAVTAVPSVADSVGG